MNAPTPICLGCGETLRGRRPQTLYHDDRCRKAWGAYLASQPSQAPTISVGEAAWIEARDQELRQLLEALIGDYELAADAWLEYGNRVG